MTQGVARCSLVLKILIKKAMKKRNGKIKNKNKKFESQCQT